MTPRVLSFLCFYLNYYRDNPVHLWGAIHESLMMLLMIVLTGQVLSYKFQVSKIVKLFRQVKGITTGLSCAVQLANAFLIAVDLAFLHAYQIHVKVYKRFADDILVVYDESHVSMHSMLELFNSSSSVVITHDDEEDGFGYSFSGLAACNKKQQIRVPYLS